MQTILDFFDQRVLLSCEESKNIASCFQQYFKRLSNPNNFDLSVPFQEQKALYEELDKDVFQSIWTYVDSRRQVADGSKVDYKSISYNLSGKYRKFLNDVATAEHYFDQSVDRTYKKFCFAVTFPDERLFV